MKVILLFKNRNSDVIPGPGIVFSRGPDSCRDADPVMRMAEVIQQIWARLFRGFRLVDMQVLRQSMLIFPQADSWSFLQLYAGVKLVIFTECLGGANYFHDEVQLKAFAHRELFSGRIKKTTSQKRSSF